MTKKNYMAMHSMTMTYVNVYRIISKDFDFERKKKEEEGHLERRMRTYRLWIFFSLHFLIVLGCCYVTLEFFNSFYQELVSQVATSSINLGELSSILIFTKIYNFF